MRQNLIPGLVLVPPEGSPELTESYVNQFPRHSSRGSVSYNLKISCTFAGSDSGPSYHENAFSAPEFTISPFLLFTCSLRSPSGSIGGRHLPNCCRSPAFRLSLPPDSRALVALPRAAHPSATFSRRVCGFDYLMI